MNIFRGPRLIFCSAAEVDEPASWLPAELGFVVILRRFRIPVPLSTTCLAAVAVADRIFGATHDASEMGAS